MIVEAGVHRCFRCVGLTGGCSAARVRKRSAAHGVSAATAG
jgi:hypothetical protein